MNADDQNSPAQGKKWMSLQDKISDERLGEIMQRVESVASIVEKLRAEIARLQLVVDEFQRDEQEASEKKRTD